jgi:hypothetical protein
MDKSEESQIRNLILKTLLEVLEETHVYEDGTLQNELIYKIQNKLDINKE